MRVLWVFCAITVLFTMHCLTVPVHRHPVVSTEQAPQSELENRNGDEQLATLAGDDLDGQLQEIRSNIAWAKTIIEHVTFSGNERVSLDMFVWTLDAQGVKVGNACDPASNFRAADEIESLYENLGYLSAKVKLVSGGSRHDREVSFEIDEGPPGMLAGIYFTGNKSIPSKVLRPLLASRVQSLPDHLPWLLWSSRESAWNRHSDEHVLRIQYMRQGFNAQVSHVKHLSEDRTRLTVEYVIEEGERTQSNEQGSVHIVFRGSPAFSEQELRAALTVREDDHFEMRLLDVVEDQISSLYRDAQKPPPTINMSLVAGSERTTIICAIDEVPADEPDIQQVAAEVGSGPRTGDRGDGQGPPNAIVSANVERRTRHEPDLRDLDRIAISGVETFNTEDIRDALRFVPEIVLASHPGADLEAFLKTLEKQVLSGYRHGGFPDAAVRAAVIEQGEQIEIRVSEGARYRCGDLKLNHALPADSPLLPLVTDPAPLAAYWKSGKPAPFDEITRAMIEAALETEFAGAGYFHPAIDFKINRHEESGFADLHVTIEQPGPRAIVGHIAVTGNERDSEADILEYLDLHAGMTCDSDLPRRVKRRLWESGRYLSAEVNTSVACAPSDGQTKTINITIKLKEYEKAPGLAQELTPTDESLIKLGEWLRRWSHGDIAEDIVATYTEIPERILAESPPGGVLQPSAVVPGETKYSLKMVIGPKRGQTLAFTALAGRPEPLFDILVASFSGRLVVASPQRLTKLEIANPNRCGLSMSLENRVVRKRTGQLEIVTRLGTTTRIFQPKPNAAAFDFDVDYSPAYMLSLAHRPQTTCASTDGITTVMDADSTLHFDAATGRLIDFHEELPNGAFAITIHTAQHALEAELDMIEGTLATATAEYDPASPWKSAAEFLVEEFRFGAQRSGLVESECSLSALRKALRLWVPPDPAELLAPYDRIKELSAEGRFWIESRSDLFTTAEAKKPGSSYRREIVAKQVLPMCRELLPKTGWWWPEARDAALCWATGDAAMITGLRKSAASRSREPELIDTSVPGPVGHVILAFANVLSKIEPLHMSRATDTPQKTIGPFHNDYEPLLKGDSWLGRWCVSFAEALRQLDEEELAALELLLPEYGSYDGGSGGLADIKRSPNTPVERVLPAILDRILGRMHGVFQQAGREGEAAAKPHGDVHPD